MKNRVCGCCASKLDGTEKKFAEIKNFDIPKEYSYEKFLPPVEDQGRTYMCVPYSICAHLEWNYNVDHKQKNTKSNNIDKKKIYNSRTVPGDNGMSFKDALEFLKKKGTTSDHGLIKIENYAIAPSVLVLKQALLVNGPCVGSFIVKDMNRPDFWNGNDYYGGHAISIIGYDKWGFIIRNSWGTTWGNSGHTILPYDEFGKLLECWTIID